MQKYPVRKAKETTQYRKQIMNDSEMSETKNSECAGVSLDSETLNPNRGKLSLGSESMKCNRGRLSRGDETQKLNRGRLSPGCETQKLNRGRLSPGCETFARLKFTFCRHFFKAASEVQPFELGVSPESIQNIIFQQKNHA
jgi:hypothetical protein